MTYFFVFFWTAMIFGSIAWFAALLFYVGAKGGREIVKLRRDLRERNDKGPPA